MEGRIKNGMAEFVISRKGLLDSFPVLLGVVSFIRVMIDRVMV